MLFVRSFSESSSIRRRLYTLHAVHGDKGNELLTPGVCIYCTPGLEEPFQLTEWIVYSLSRVTHDSIYLSSVSLLGSTWKQGPCMKYFKPNSTDVSINQAGRLRSLRSSSVNELRIRDLGCIDMLFSSIVSHCYIAVNHMYSLYCISRIFTSNTSLMSPYPAELMRATHT